MWRGLRRMRKAESAGNSGIYNCVLRPSPYTPLPIFHSPKRSAQTDGQPTDREAPKHLLPRHLFFKLTAPAQSHFQPKMELSTKILASGGKEREQAAKRRLLEFRRAPTALLTGGPGQSRLKLQERLKEYTEDDADPVPLNLMRKYIAYARAYVNPVLCAEAKQVGCSCEA